MLKGALKGAIAAIDSGLEFRANVVDGTLVLSLPAESPDAT